MFRSGASRSRPAAAAVTTLAAATLAACGASGGADRGAPGGDPDSPDIVASTNIYASITEAVLGEPGSVTAIVEDTMVDPHSFEASPADAARITNADLVVYNGAGYDAFVDRALDTTDGVSTVVGADAFEAATGTAVEGHNHGEGEHEHADHGHDAEERGDHGDHGDAAGHEHGSATTQNEHVWTSLPAAGEIATRIADELGRLDPENAHTYASNAADFTAEIDGLRAEVDALHESAAGTAYAQSEPIGQHLFDEIGLADSTPETFLSAIHAGSDPAARDFDSILRLVEGDDIAFFAYNTQTETAVTSRIREAAEANDVAVLELTETLPGDTDYLTWISDITARTAEALES